MQRQQVFDVVVVGGGSAGVAAAVGAAQTGANTLLLERGPCLGGEATQANIAAYCGFHARGNPPVQVVDGVGGMVLEKLRSLGEDTDYVVSKATGNPSIRFDPEALKLALDEVVLESSVELLLHAQLIGASVSQGRITCLECVDDMGRFYVVARSFVDATGDANLAHLSGCQTIWGDEHGQTQQASLCARIDHISAHADTSPAAMAVAIQRAKEDGMANLDKEKGFLIRGDGADYGFCTTPSVTVASLDAKSLTLAEQEARKKARAYHQALRAHLPGMQDSRLVCTGPTLGLRETRRVVGLQSLTQADVLQCKKREDVIARGGWSPELHRPGAEVDYLHLHEGAWFDIPMGCIQAKDVRNLWCAGRNISCDAVAHASVRVMGTGFATGHAAGVAAALSQRRADQGPELSAIQAELRRQGALL